MEDKGEIELINLHTKKHIETKLCLILEKNKFVNLIDYNNNGLLSLYLFFHNYILIEKERLKINRKMEIVNKYCNTYNIVGIDRYEIINEFKYYLVINNYNLAIYCQYKNIHLSNIFNNWKFYRNYI